MTIDLRRLFLSLQSQLVATLEAGRKVISHPGAKGEAAELRWREMLADHLPSRYQVSKAFVIDAHGSLSDQIDVVVHDRQYSPLLFNQDGALYVPAESVYAVFEVKQELNREAVEYSGSKAASVRRLRRTSAAIPHAGGTFAPRPVFPILAGILCLDSSWNPPLGTALIDSLIDLAGENRLDLGCVARHGAFEISYPDAEAPRIEQTTADNALIFFFLRLLHRLQQLGTVPAIDLKEYGRSL